MSMAAEVQYIDNNGIPYVMRYSTVGRATSAAKRSKDRVDHIVDYINIRIGRVVSVTRTVEWNTPVK